MGATRRCDKSAWENSRLISEFFFLPTRGFYFKFPLRDIFLLINYSPDACISYYNERRKPTESVSLISYRVQFTDLYITGLNIRIFFSWKISREFCFQVNSTRKHSSNSQSLHWNAINTNKEPRDSLEIGRKLRNIYGVRTHMLRPPWPPKTYRPSVRPTDRPTDRPIWPKWRS